MADMICHKVYELLMSILNNYISETAKCKSLRLKIHHYQQIDWKFFPDYGIFPEILQMVKWIAGARFDIK
jgi:hypothetical protein